MNTVINILNNRVSLRNYEEKEISEDHLAIILNSAMRAPTAGNMMLYSIIQVESQDKKEKLSITCDNQPFIAQAPLVLVFLADYQKWYDYYILNNVKDYCIENNIVFTKPSEGSLLLASSDALIAAQNVVIAAESLGIGSCYIGDIMENYEEHRKILNLPDYVFPVAMLCLGYYPDNYKRKLRDRFDEKYIVFKDEYNRLSQEEIKDMYEDIDKRFVENNKFNAENYAQMHYAFKTGAPFFREMARSVREALKNWDEGKL
jgi:FMN reductase (NADPH)